MPTIFKKKPFLLPDEDEPSFRLGDDMADGAGASSGAAVPSAAGTGRSEPTATELMQYPSPPLEPPGVQPRWTALDQYSDVVSQRPQLKRASGWKGALQTIGEITLAPEVIHPNYTRQMRDYGEAVGEAKAQADIEEKAIERGVNQAKLESTQSLNARRGALAEKQGAVAERQLQKLDEPKPKPEMVEITEERGKKLDLKPDAEGRYWIPLSQIQILRPSAEANPTEWALYLNAAGGDPKKALQLKLADELKLRVAGRAPRGGGDDDGRKIPSATAANIEGEKMAARMDARDWADAEIKRIKAGVRPPDPALDTQAKGRPRFSTTAEAEAWAQKEIDRAQRIYEGKIGAATGNYPKSSQAPVTQGPPPLPAMEKPTKKTYSEAEVRQRAAAQGVNPDAAVAKAKTAGLLR